DVVLPQREPVVVASRKVADVERDHREGPDLSDSTLTPARRGLPRMQSIATANRASSRAPPRASFTTSIATTASADAFAPSMACQSTCLATTVMRSGLRLEKGSSLRRLRHG